MQDFDDSSFPILRTRLVLPTVRVGWLPRVRLVDWLTSKVEKHKLTLLTAPAGYGKTVLLAQWSAQPRWKDQIAWISLDKGDNQPERFLSYLVAALQPFIGPEYRTNRPAQSQLSPEAELIGLLNGLAPVLPADAKLTLTLDNYHLIQNEAVNALVAFFLEYAPTQLRVVLAGRSNPALPLQRLRLDDNLAQLGVCDLRFDEAEVAEFIAANTNDGPDLNRLLLAAAPVEGWPAGLQLAVSALRDSSNDTTFAKAFGPYNPYIAQYLDQEVLDGQPPTLRDFLLQTSLLERINPQLVESIIGHKWARQAFGQLEQASLFLVPSEEHAGWFRYQRLFGYYLQNCLRQEQPERLAELHLKASQWFEQNGSLCEAIDHALAVPDFDRATRLLGRLVGPMIAHGEHIVLDRWLAQFPRKMSLPSSGPLAQPLEPTDPANDSRFLSEREAEVLQMIASGASNQEIAEQLVIALSTVKKHTTSIFNKLDVTNRTQAILRAGEVRVMESKSPTSLTVWTIGLKNNPIFVTYMTELFAGYQKLHPRVSVNWEDFSGNDIQLKLMVALSSGEVPDLVNLNTNFILKFASKGALEDLSGMVSTRSQARFIPTLYDATRIGEAVYGIPWYLSVPIMMINKGLFLKADLDPHKPPRTFEEALQIAQIMHYRTGDYAFQPVTTFAEDALMEGFPILSQDKRKAAFNTLTALAKLAYYENFKQGKLIPSEVLYYDTAYEDAVDLYKAGKLAILMAGGSLLTKVEKDAPEIYRNTLVAPHPLGKAGLLPTQMMHFGVLKASPNQRAALELALHITSDPNQVAFNKLAVILPSTTEASQNRLFKDAGDPRQEARKIMANHLPIARDGTVTIENYIQLTQVLNDNLREWWHEGKPAHQALTDASKEWDTLLNGG